MSTYGQRSDTQSQADEHITDSKNVSAKKSLLVGRKSDNDFEDALIDTDGHLQVDVQASGLPTGAATSANQLPDGHNVTVDNGVGAAAVNIRDGNNSITIDNAALSLTGAGNETNVLRVTIANNSTGVLSVDDNGGNISIDDGGNTITVDGTVTANAGTGTINVSEQNTGLAGTGTAGTLALASADTWYSIPSTAPTNPYTLIIAKENAAGTIRYAFANGSTPSATFGLTWTGTDPLIFELAGSAVLYVGSSSAGDDVNWTCKEHAA